VSEEEKNQAALAKCEAEFEKLKERLKEAP